MRTNFSQGWGPQQLTSLHSPEWSKDYMQRIVRKIRATYPSSHPVLHFPGWMEPVEPDLSRSGTKSVPIREIDDFLTPLRLISKTGLELRFTPTPEGLHSSLFYHHPAASEREKDIVVNLIDWMKSPSAKDIAAKADRLYAWQIFFEGSSATPHEIMERHVALNKLKGGAELNPPIVHELHHFRGTIFRYPGLDIQSITDMDNGININAAHQDGDDDRDIYQRNRAAELFGIPHELLCAACDQMNEEIRKTSWKIKFRIKLLNAKSEFSHALNFVGKKLGLTKKQR